MFVKMGKMKKIELVIEKIRRLKGLKSDAKVAELLGLTRQGLSDYKRRDTLPFEKLKDFCEKEKLVFDEILSIEDVHLQTPETTDYIHIPLYDVHAAAGAGSYVDNEEKKDLIVFRRWFIEEELRGTAEDFSLIFVEGESMAPTLRPGEIIMVDHRDNSFLRDGVYVMQMDGTLIVKTVRSLPDNQAEIISDNPAFGKFSINKKEPPPDFRVVGRVVLGWKRH